MEYYDLQTRMYLRRKNKNVTEKQKVPSSDDLQPRENIGFEQILHQATLGDRRCHMNIYYSKYSVIGDVFPHQ